MSEVGERLVVKIDSMLFNHSVKDFRGTSHVWHTHVDLVSSALQMECPLSITVSPQDLLNMFDLFLPVLWFGHLVICTVK